MKQNKGSVSPSSLSKVVAVLLDLPWIEILTEAWKLGRKILRGLADEGMYEVLEYESTLELLDKQGKKAILQKRKKVRYLQNNIIAYQDYGWGDGEQFQSYKAKPGIKVDQYKVGYKTYILLSLREVKNRGDVDEFHIQWKIGKGFLKKDGFWETDVSSRTHQMKVRVIFPEARPPHNVRLVENNRQKTTPLNGSAKKQLPDGRWQVTWETLKPRLYEHYILRWDW
jgi:hypothetical protein